MPVKRSDVSRGSASQEASAAASDFSLFRGSNRVFGLVYTVAGCIACVATLLHPEIHDAARFLLYLLCANLAVLCLRLTAGRSLLSAGFLILLLGMQDLSRAELLFVACAMTLSGELQLHRGRLHFPSLFFHLGSVSLGIASAHLVYSAVSNFHFSALFPAPIIAGSFVLLFNYGISRALLNDGASPLIGLYREECRPLLPWFIAAAYLAYLISAASLHTGVHAALLALPILFALDRGYRAWSHTREDHAAELALLHRRTLETLSVVINARDHTADQHLRRVQFYAKAVAQELGLNQMEMEDLRVATLVYNIGQLGVPDHILLKPGTLTAEEWEKVKTHPFTGAEMLARMNFPPGVIAIVQTHHEKWNGTGYPAGLKGDAIPIGARVLAAVDCLDALASDRPFRDALTLGDAMERVHAEGGKSFDPRVVEVLARRYQDLERRAQIEIKNSPSPGRPSSTPHDIGQLAARLLIDDAEKDSIVDPIVAARKETELLRVLAVEVGRSLHCSEIAAAAHKCLSQIVPYDTLVLYVPNGDQIQATGVAGRSAHRFLREPVPASGALSARALHDGIPILNGNPSQEPACVQDPYLRHPLQSALAMPLEGRSGPVGVVTLYHTTRDAFTRDHLRFLKAVSGSVSAAVEGALKYQNAESLAGTDHLTGIANARSLALHLDRELSRASRDKSSIGVLLCDLNGFKGVNDRFGHLKGNEVLQAVARGLRDACRGSDYFARMGGDEFVVVVPGLKDEMCLSYLQRIETVAVEAGLAACGERCISASVGISIYPFDGHESETLLRKADERMYSAKERHKSGEGSSAAVR